MLSSHPISAHKRASGLVTSSFYGCYGRGYPRSRKPRQQVFTGERTGANSRMQWEETCGLLQGRGSSVGQLFGKRMMLISPGRRLMELPDLVNSIPIPVVGVTAATLPCA